MTAADLAQHACASCGAGIEYAPGTAALECPYCGHLNEITRIDAGIDESDYLSWLSSVNKPVGSLQLVTMTCSNCGASVQMDAVATRCPFCSSPLVLSEVPDQITPEAVIPFGVTRNEANERFSAWVRSRRFAPNALRKVSSTESIQGTYLPHWTFDTTSDYTGQRGEYYYVTVSYTATENGRSVRRTRQERRTRWYPASGRVARDFDDVLVPAAHPPQLAGIGDVGPWDLSAAQPYQSEYLAGYEALRYTVHPPEGLSSAKEEMRPAIEEDARRDIGGDTQRINQLTTAYQDIMFKLVLLPLWIASYIYQGKSYQVVINANTGEVLGQHPRSWVKIFFAVLLAAVLLAAVVYFVYLSRTPGAVPFWQ